MAWSRFLQTILYFYSAYYALILDFLYVELAIIGLLIWIKAMFIVVFLYDLVIRESF